MICTSSRSHLDYLQIIASSRSFLVDMEKLCIRSRSRRSHQAKHGTDHADHTDPTWRNTYMKIRQIVQIPPGETCADHADHTDPTWRNTYMKIRQNVQIPPGEACADHADGTDPTWRSMWRSCRSYRSHLAKHVQIMQIIQIPLGETCADHADRTDPARRRCADHADRTACADHADPTCRRYTWAPKEQPHSANT